VPWVIILLGGLFLAFPIYWYLHIWRDKETNPEPVSQGLQRVAASKTRRYKIGVLLASLFPVFLMLIVLAVVLRRLF
jgi:hypothetical protein